VSRSRIINAIRSGNNYYVPVQPTPPWREEDEKRWSRLPLKPDPQPEQPALEPEVPQPAPAIAPESSPQPQPVPLIESFEALVSLLGEYLACSDHQRTVLALWIIHTYCFEVFIVTPYLNVCSPEKQSGKTVCMKLLSLLANNSWMPPGGLTATRLMEHIAQRRPTVLLDDWHTAFRPSETQSIIGFLNAGSAEETRYSARSSDAAEKDIYCPKAFAGAVDLPPSLADRSIPIVLQRPRAAEHTLPFCGSIVRARSGPLVKQVRQWVADKTNYHNLFQLAADLFLGDLPGFSPRRRELALPLLTIAHMLGGKWPRRARIALLRIFDIHTDASYGLGLQLLACIRSFFVQHPQRRTASTAELLKYLIGLEDHPWKRYHGVKPLTPNGLRALLRKYEIRRAASQHLEDGRRAKGFSRADFQDAWDRYLPEVVTAPSEVVTNAPEVVTKSSEVVTQTPEVVTTISVSAGE